LFNARNGAHHHLFKFARNANRHKQIRTGAIGVEQLSKLPQIRNRAETHLAFAGEMGGNPKRNPFVHWSLDERAVGTGLPTHTVQEDSFPIKLLKRANAEITVVCKIFHLQRLTKHSFYDRT